jgi:uncharacterized membrane protein
VSNGNAPNDRNDNRKTARARAGTAGDTVLDAVAGVRRTVSDKLPNARGKQTSSSERNVTEARSSITINAPAATVYDTWRDFNRLPTFMYHLESVATTGDGRSHWIAKAPAGTTVEWDAEMVQEEPGSRLAWRSLEGSDIENAGEVRFAKAPRDQGTEVHVALAYRAPAGAVGVAVAKLFGEEPHQQLMDDLRRFKQLIETGEVTRSDGTPVGTSAGKQLRQRPAQPLDDKARARSDREVMA